MKAAVVGCGGIGRAHALAWQQVAGAELTYVVDRDPARAEALGDETGAEALLDLDDLPDDVAIVSLTTDPLSHAALAEQCLVRGHAVFCEKPLGMTVAQALRLLEASRQAGRALSVGFKMRYEPIFVKARELCPEVGDIVQIATTKTQPFSHRGAGEWRPRVGAMFELSVHDFDLIGAITGLQPRRVLTAQLSHRLGWEREDGFAALVEYQSAAGERPCQANDEDEAPIAACSAPSPETHVMASLSGCYTTGSKWLGADFSLTVTGEKGYLRILRGDRIILHTDQLHTFEPEPPDNTFVSELQAFADAVAADAPPPIPAEAGYTATALIEAIWNTGCSGAPTDLVEM